MGGFAKKPHHLIVWYFILVSIIVVRMNVDLDISSNSSIPIATLFSIIVLSSYFGLMKLKGDWGKVLGDDFKFRDWIYLIELGIHSLAMYFAINTIFLTPETSDNATVRITSDNMSPLMTHIYVASLLVVILFWIGFWSYSLVEDRHRGKGKEVAISVCHGIGMGYIGSYLFIGFIFGWFAGLFVATMFSGLLFLLSFLEIFSNKHSIKNEDDDGSIKSSEF